MKGIPPFMRDQNTLPDMQNSKPDLEIPIQRVGITELKLPIYISKKDGSFQHTVADVNVFVDLKSTDKGTHMSRLAIGVQKFMDQQLNRDLLDEITQYIRSKLEAETAEVIYRFPYFLKRNAPVSKEPGVIHCNVIFDLIKNSDYTKFIMGVETTTTSLCPCSREISDSGAHNQRSKIKIKCIPKKDKWVWLEDLIDIAQDCSSCEIYSSLKRTDEKYVTERAFGRPKFVEDMIREIFSKLDKREDLDWFQVEVTNEESIHQHNAYAKMESVGDASP